jgi:aminoglycoside/choline kinase family phosphotransferase
VTRLSASLNFTEGALLRHPLPLCDALARYPQTLIHGDYKAANLGLTREGTSSVMLLDWALVGIAPPAVDLAWYVGLASLRLPVSKEEAIERYRQSLARHLGAEFEMEWWRPQLALGLLGGLLQLGYWIAWLAVQHPDEDLRIWAQGELSWWSVQVRGGTTWL